MVGKRGKTVDQKSKMDRILSGLYGIYKAEVVDTADPERNGRIKVKLTSNDLNKTFWVKWTTPFGGATKNKGGIEGATEYNEGRTSYGMWMVPPDIGNQVLVGFNGGDENDPYCLGCLFEPFMNHMVPGIPAGRDSDGNVLPVIEQDKTSDEGFNPEYKYKQGSSKVSAKGGKRPTHDPLAAILEAQGISADWPRGLTTSGARRESPSEVFGILTPGPLADGSGTREGGHSFIMDDHDRDSQIRLRTRNGMQILLHDATDTIFIINKYGTGYIEIDSQGNMDFFADGNFSVRARGDINLRGDKDVNIEAGADVNIKARNDTPVPSEIGGLSLSMEGGKPKVGLKLSSKYGIIHPADNLGRGDPIWEALQLGRMHSKGGRVNIYGVNGLNLRNDYGGVRLSSKQGKVGIRGKPIHMHSHGIFNIKSSIPLPDPSLQSQLENAYGAIGGSIEDAASGLLSGEGLNFENPLDAFIPRGGLQVDVVGDITINNGITPGTVKGAVLDGDLEEAAASAAATAFIPGNLYFNSNGVSLYSSTMGIFLNTVPIPKMDAAKSVGNAGRPKSKVSTNTTTAQSSIGLPLGGAVAIKRVAQSGDASSTKDFIKNKVKDAVIGTIAESLVGGGDPYSTVPSLLPEMQGGPKSIISRWNSFQPNPARLDLGSNPLFNMVSGGLKKILDDDGGG